MSSPKEVEGQDTASLPRRTIDSDHYDQAIATLTRFVDTPGRIAIKSRGSKPSVVSRQLLSILFDRNPGQGDVVEATRPEQEETQLKLGDAVEAVLIQNGEWEVGPVIVPREYSSKPSGHFELHRPLSAPETGSVIVVPELKRPPLIHGVFIQLPDEHLVTHIPTRPYESEGFGTGYHWGVAKTRKPGEQLVHDKTYGRWIDAPLTYVSFTQKAVRGLLYADGLQPDTQGLLVDFRAQHNARGHTVGHSRPRQLPG